MKITKTQIEIFLQDIEGFDQNEKDRWGLEQHMTTPQIASEAILEIYSREQDLDQKVVGDLGCGTGMLMSGMLCIGAMKVIGLEIDQKYIMRTYDQLMEKFEDPSLFDLINVNVKQWKNDSHDRLFDLVVMNPPFGTKDEGIDLIFLEKARDNCSGNIYSMHKSSTRDFLCKTAKSWGYEFEVIKKYKFPLPKRFNKYHKKEMGFTDVDFICLSPTPAVIQQREIEAEQKRIINQQKWLEIINNFEQYKWTFNKKAEQNNDEEDDDDDDEEEEEEEDEDEEDDEENEEEQKQEQNKSQ